MENVENNKQMLIEAVTNFANCDMTPLSELFALKAVIATCQDRISEIMPDAKNQAIAILAAEKPARQSGEFEFGGHTFELSLTENYEFVKNAHRYNNAESARIRQLMEERKHYQDLASAKTNLIDAERKNFRATYPHWDPDSVTKVLKVKGL